MIEQASWLIQPIKGNRSKRLFGLPASLVRGEKIAQFRLRSIHKFLLLPCLSARNGADSDSKDMDTHPSYLDIVVDEWNGGLFHA